MDDWESHQFLDYLNTTFKPEELTLVLQQLLKLPDYRWKEIADQQSGSDAFNHHDKISPLFENYIAEERKQGIADKNENKEPSRVFPNHNFVLI